MALTDYPIDLLICPHSRELSIVEGELKGKEVSYPLVDDIPWLFKHPQSQLDQWSSRARQYLAQLENRITRLSIELDKVDGGLAAKRLQLLHAAYTHNLEVWRELLQPLELGEVDGQNMMAVVGEKVPASQILASYNETTFRDWSWSTGEVETHLSTLEKVIPNQLNWGHFAVLGSGASRLAYDVHRKYSPEMTLIVDINPLLLLLAQTLVHGNEVELFEIPQPALGMDTVAVKQLLKAPVAITEGLQFLFADAMNLPLKPKCLDTLLTPWLIDIIPQDFSAFAKRVNHHLKKGGTWLNFGPLGFQRESPRECYIREEVLEILESSGFKVHASEVTAIPYLQSPSSSYGRQEKVFSFSATKVSDAKEPKHYDYLPDYLRDYSKPIPVNQFLQKEAFSHQVHYQILASVNGEVSVNELSTLMTSHFGMTPEQAREALVAMLTSLFEKEASGLV